MTAVDHPSDDDISPSLRAANLFREAKALAESNTRDFAVALEALIERAKVIAQGGDVYAPGVREICGTFSGVAVPRAQALDAIVQRPQPPPRPARFTPEPTFLLSPEARLAPSAAVVERLNEVRSR